VQFVNARFVNAEFIDRQFTTVGISCDIGHTAKRVIVGVQDSIACGEHRRKPES
jgi:hypothetical protein